MEKILSKRDFAAQHSRDSRGSLDEWFGPLSERASPLSFPELARSSPLALFAVSHRWIDFMCIYLRLL